MTGKDMLDYLSQPTARWIMAGLVVVAALGLGGLALSGRGGEDARASGSELTLAVVAPVEPDVEPGGVMDVGQLTNGFDGQMPDAAPAAGPVVEDYYAEQPAYTESRQYASAPPPVRSGDEAHLYLEPPARDGGRPQDGDPRAFGFDQPRPDYQREREARRAAMEAREAERQARRDRPDPGPDAFY